MRQRTLRPRALKQSKRCEQQLIRDTPFPDIQQIQDTAIVFLSNAAHQRTLDFKRDQPMTITLKAFAAAAAVLTIVSVPAAAENTAPASRHSNPVVSAEVTSKTVHVRHVEAGVFGFSADRIAGEFNGRSCDYFRKRAQWSDAHNWWKKYTRCLSAQPGS